MTLVASIRFKDLFDQRHAGCNLHAFFLVLTLVLITLAQTACMKSDSPTEPVVQEGAGGPLELRGRTMGTTYSVKIAGALPDGLTQEKLQKEIDAVLVEVNRQMSTYIADSEISLLNKAPADKAVAISDWFYNVLQFSLQVARQTDGAYDPTLGPLINLWGFGPDGERKVPDDAAVAETRKYVGFAKVGIAPAKSGQKQGTVTKASQQVYVDLSSSAKGFGVDKVAEHLLDKGMNDFLVEIGGELRAGGTKFGKAWMVAIEKPVEGRRAVMEPLQLGNMSIATSGSYRNFYRSDGKRYSHTIDFRTGRPIAHNLISASVLDPECMKADAYATALMALGAEKAVEFAKKQGLAVYLIYKKDDAAGPKVFKSAKFLELQSGAQ